MEVRTISTKVLLNYNKEEIRTFTIDKQQMERFRELAPFWKNAD